MLFRSPILNRIRSLLEPWLGHAGFDQSPVAPKLRFRVPAEDDPTTQIRYYFLLGRTVTMSEAPSVRGARAVKLIAIGNSKGIRLPKALSQKYGWSDSLVLEETGDGILLYGPKKISSPGETPTAPWPRPARTGKTSTRRSPMDWIDGSLSQALRCLLCRPQPHGGRRNPQGEVGRGGQSGRGESVSGNGR